MTSLQNSLVAHFTTMLVAGFCLSACGTSNACINGESRACACPTGESGAQVCAGGEFEMCICSGGRDGGPRDAGPRDAGPGDAALPPSDSSIDASGGADAPDMERDASAPGAMCIGNALECRHMPREGCNDQLGCIYDDFSGCSGTRTLCDSFGGAGTCGDQRGCQWETPSAVSGICIGQALECRHMPREECNDQLGCIYDDFSGCVGTTTVCENFEGGATCGAQRGCQWETPAGMSGTCIGEALECRHMPREECNDQLGCIYDDFSGCVGARTGCERFEGGATCGAQRGCQWETPAGMSGTCIGEALECRRMPREECNDQLGCIYDDFSGCVGMRTLCERFEGAATCGAQRGCQWE